MKKIVVTGASGYIGRAVVRAARTQGYEVVFATRRAPPSDQAWLPYDLHSKDLALPVDTFAVVHLAADTRGSDIDADVELSAARLLAGRAQECGARMVFVSSQTAHPDAPTTYGRTKWAIEHIVLERSGRVVRPGQVYGADETALFGKIVALVRRSPFLPAFVPSPRIQPVHVDDLADAILCVVERGADLKPVFEIGAVESVTFTEFLGAIAKNRVRRFRAFVPVPAFAIGLLAMMLGKQGANSTSIGRLTSLFALRPMCTRDDLEIVGVHLRPLNSGMHASGDGRRRVLIREGRALLNYVLKRQPTTTLVRRYVRAACTLGRDDGCGLSPVALTCPATIAVFERLDHKTTDRKVLEALAVATSLAEASTEGAPRFVVSASRGAFVGAAVDVAWAICREVSIRIPAMALHVTGLTRREKPARHVQ